MNFNPAMKSDPDQDLLDFVDRFLAYHGAVVERKAAGLEALLPEKLYTLLGTTEHIVIPRDSAFAADKGDSFLPEGVFPISYGSELLEKMVNTVFTQIPLLACQLEFNYVKSQGFEALIKESFKFFGSVGSVESRATIRTDYIFLACKYLAQSDEQKEGLLWLAFNMETGAHVPEMVESFFIAAKTYPRYKNTFDWKEEQIQRIMTWVSKEAKDALVQEIGPFQESMNRRLRRDLANLEEYYGGLENEMQLSLERTGLSDQLIRDRQEKIAQIPEELARKKEDLFKKYSIRVKIEPCTAMVVTTPAIKILYRASIGRKVKNLSMIYNPATKAIDPLLCEGCGRGTHRIYFCDRLHILCPGCASLCPVCRT